MIAIPESTLAVDPSPRTLLREYPTATVKGRYESLLERGSAGGYRSKTKTITIIYLIADKHPLPQAHTIYRGAG